MTTTDTIRILGLRGKGFHGVLEHERREGQEFLVDLGVHLDTRRAATSDDLAATVDYGVLSERVVAIIEGEPCDLIETLAERVAACVLQDQQIHGVDVTVHKPQAPITVPFRDVELTIARSRDHVPAVPEPCQAVDGPETTSAAEGPVPVLAPVPALVPEPVPEGTEADEADTGSQHVAAADRLDERPDSPVTAVLALGANLGDAATVLREAVRDLDEVSGVTVETVGPLARTLPVGGPEQPDYLNTVVVVTTTLAPRELLRAAHRVEASHGRERTVRWGPRTLDVDIVTFGSLVDQSDDLEIPHPRARERAFVLLPWAHAVPGAMLPGLGGGPVEALAQTAPDRDGIRALALDWFRGPDLERATAQEDQLAPGGTQGQA